MIVVPVQEGFELVTQTDHAHLSGRLAALWRDDGLPQSPRRDDILFACREHDNGWREADAAPHLHPDGDRPHDFVSLPLTARAELWRRGVQRYVEERPYGALLIARHAELLHRDQRDAPELAALFELLEVRREELLEVTGADPDGVAADHRFVAATDLVSLVAVNRWTEPFSVGVGERTVCGRLEGDTVHLEPLPLAGATTFRVPYRVLPRRRYAGDADLAVELASARWQERTVRLAP